MAQKAFKTAFLGGFRKNDVVSYLESLNSMVQAKRSDGEARENELRCRISELEHQLSLSTEKQDNMEFGLSDTKAQIDDITAQKNQLEQEKRHMLKQIDSMRSYIDSLEKQGNSSAPPIAQSAAACGDMGKAQIMLSEMLLRLGEMAAELAGVISPCEALKSAPPLTSTSAKREKSPDINAILSQIKRAPRA